MYEKILVVDDEKELADLLEVYLQNDGYSDYKFYNGMDALRCIESNTPDLAILDVMLPDIDGFHICQKIREKYFFPVIMLTAKIEDSDKIMGLTIGADDYITKPFKPSLLNPKCLELLKRNKKIEINQIKSGNILLDLDKHILVIEEDNITLTDKEFKLLHYLMKNQGIVLSREKILDTLWGYDYYGDGRAVDTYIKRLRKRLGNYSYYIQTVVKTGYMWKGEES